ncbi:MAG: hypothetical protein JWL84_2115 [Rhodospirillales bacterium]|jgi:hypothetical protein|nr:hypothetical protein [Rhodospirillales bacterium]
MNSPPGPSLRKRVIRRLDSLAGEINSCLIVAAIGLACVDLVGYAAEFSQSRFTDAYATPWGGAVDAIGTAPILGAGSFSQ